MDDREKAELFIKCGKNLETYMMKLDLEGKAPKLWLLDRYWRMKNLYEAKPFLMRMIQRAKSSKKFLSPATVGAFGAVGLSALSMLLCKMPVVPIVFAISSVVLSLTSAVMNFMITDYISSDTYLEYVENWNKLLNSSLGRIVSSMYSKL